MRLLWCLSMYLKTETLILYAPAGSKIVCRSILLLLLLLKLCFSPMHQSHIQVCRDYLIFLRTPSLSPEVFIDVSPSVKRHDLMSPSPHLSDTLRHHLTLCSPCLLSSSLSHSDLYFQFIYTIPDGHVYLYLIAKNWDIEIYDAMC